MLNNKNILVTGAAGFIGFHLCRKLIESGYNVVGYDNMNHYYNVFLKELRMKKLGIDKIKAKEIQADYFYKYDTSLNGLMKNYPDLIDPNSIATISHSIRIVIRLNNTNGGENTVHVPFRKSRGMVRGRSPMRVGRSPSVYGRSPKQ